MTVTLQLGTLSNFPDLIELDFVLHDIAGSINNGDMEDRTK